MDCRRTRGLCSFFRGVEPTGNDRLNKSRSKNRRRTAPNHDTPRLQNFGNPLSCYVCLLFSGLFNSFILSSTHRRPTCVLVHSSWRHLYSLYALLNVIRNEFDASGRSSFFIGHDVNCAVRSTRRIYFYSADRAQGTLI